MMQELRGAGVTKKKNPRKREKDTDGQGGNAAIQECDRDERDPAVSRVVAS